MFKIALINMPFASLRLPSIALTQLRSVVLARHSERVSTDIHYLNHDFVEYFGREHYDRIAEFTLATVSGVGDWFFRQVAFPQLPDNTDQYLSRYGRTLGLDAKSLKTFSLLRAGLDAFLDELIDQYKLDTAGLVGFTSMFAQNVASFALARKLKDRNPDVVTVMGGANCEASMGGVIARNVAAIDFVFSGHSLKTFPTLVQYLMQGERDKCHDIRGVFSQQKSRRNALTGTNEIGEELELDVDVPLHYEAYLSAIEGRFPGVRPALLFETSRGCWWGERAHCTFCGLNGTTMKYRAMAAAKAIHQFEHLFTYYPRVSRFEAVDNILPREYLTTVLPHLKPPEAAQLFYEVKADLKEDEMKVLADAKVTEIQPGIEALATSTLKLMKKGTTSFQNLKFLSNCAIYGIKPVWNLLIGFPGEPETVYRKYADDLPRLVHLPPPLGCFPVRFDRFSPYFVRAQEYGLKLRPCPFYAMVYPFAEQDLNELAYFFVDENYENQYMASTAKWVKKLEKCCADWAVRWYQRDGNLKPVLAFAHRGPTRIVLDTRSGSTIEHQLEPDALRLLDCLVDPLEKRRLAGRLTDLRDAELDGHLSHLIERGLLFEEDGRYLSLVLDAPADQQEVSTAEYSQLTLQPLMR